MLRRPTLMTHPATRQLTPTVNVLQQHQNLLQSVCKVMYTLRIYSKSSVLILQHSCLITIACKSFTNAKKGTKRIHTRLIIIECKSHKPCVSSLLQQLCIVTWQSCPQQLPTHVAPPGNHQTCLKTHTVYVF
jgi:hypothetical protein